MKQFKHFSFSLTVLILISLTACGSPEPLSEPAAEAPQATAVPTAIPASPTPTDVPPTAPPPATATPIPTTTTTPGETADLQPTSTAIPEETLNGIPLSQLIVLDEETITHMREIFAQGQTLGRNSYRFSKLGDSVIANGDFLTRFDQPNTFVLGPYEELRPVITHFQGSWDRFGVGMRIGLHAWGVFDPMWANKDWCEPNEVIIECEFRLNNPAVVLIHLGTNDTSDSYPLFMRRVIEHSLEEGVIPIIMTKADRFEGEDNRNNLTMRELAGEYRVPLLDYDLIAATLPDRGLKEDGVHMNGPLQHDYNLEETLQKGHTVHNLVVLFMLEEILNEVIRLES